MKYVHTSTGAALKGYIIGWLSNCGPVVPLPHLLLRSFVILPHHLLYWASSKGKEETVSSKVKAMRDNMWDKVRRSKLFKVCTCFVYLSMPLWRCCCWLLRTPPSLSPLPPLPSLSPCTLFILLASGVGLRWGLLESSSSHVVSTSAMLEGAATKIPMKNLSPVELYGLSGTKSAGQTTSRNIYRMISWMSPVL